MISDMTASIAAATEEQSTVTAEVSRNLSTIRDVAQQAAATTAEASTGTDELVSLAANLDGLTRGFKVSGGARD